MLGISFLLPLVAAGEPALVPAFYVAQTWNVDSGLPDNSVRALVRTGDGYLWLGTAAGLVRFDGVRFQIYNRSNTPELGEDRILSLYEDIDGVLWVGTDGGGLCAYRAGAWSRYREGDGIQDGHVRAITGDWSGTLWVGTERGLHRIDEEGLSSYGLDEGLADDLLTALALDGLKRLWAGTMWGGLARFEEGLARSYGLDEGLGDRSILSLYAEPRGDLWIGTMRGLYRLGPRDEIMTPVGSSQRYPVTALSMDPGNRLLVGTMVEGLKILDDSSTPIDVFPDDALGNSHVRAVLAGRDGMVWLGTESLGLVRLRERTVGSITASEGLPEGSVYAIEEDVDGSLWIGTEKSGICRVSGGRIARILDRSGGLAGNMVRALSRDPSGGLWVGTRDGGLSVITSSGIANTTAAEGLASDNVTALLHGDDGAAWVGTDRGLYGSADGDPGGLQPVDSLENSTIRTLLEDGGALYAGTRSGLWKRSGSSFARVEVEDGRLDLDILSLYGDTDGGLWIGTNGDGLGRLSGRKLTIHTKGDGLPGNFIYSISEDDSGRLWMSCETGVFHISRDSLAAYAAGRTRILAPTLYDASDGMPSDRCNGLCCPAVGVTASGERYYPTKGGVAVFGGESGRKPGRPPTVLIESIRADGVARQMDLDLDLPAGTGTVEIRFTGLDWAAPARCRFLFRLGGHDADWRALHPHQERTAVYSRLPPGEYEFAVWAIGNNGLWSEGAASVAFAVLPPFYRTRTFLLAIVGVVLLTGGAVAAQVRYRRTLKRRTKYRTSTIDDARMERALVGLNALMEDEKVYLDPDLTLKTLAQRLSIHYNHLSRIINERYDVSYSDYVNRHRVEEAQKRLADPAFDNKSILEIMYEVGFYTKSTFNTAFKKFAGSSPSEYRRKHR